MDYAECWPWRKRRTPSCCGAKFLWRKILRFYAMLKAESKEVVAFKAELCEGFLSIRAFV